MKKSPLVLAGIILWLVFPLPAQEAGPSLSLGAADIRTLQTLPDDQLRALLAVLGTTPTLAVDSLPRHGVGGTFYSLQHPGWPALPGDVNGAAVWSLTGGAFLLDDLGFNYNAPKKGRLASGGVRVTSLDVPLPGGGGGTGTNTYAFTPAVYTTNDLWLAWLGPTALLIHPPGSVTDGVYDLFFTTNLAASWRWVSRTEAGQTQVTVTDPAGDTGFFLLALTNDADGDGVSDAFARLVAAGGLDQIQFSLFTLHGQLNTGNAAGQVFLEQGTPFYEAVLVDDTNLAAAGWQPYTTPDVVVNLGAGEGEHTVRVGLKGRPPDAAPVWRQLTFRVDTVPPVLAVTRPAAAVVSVPVVQLQGWADEALGSLTFDVSNAAGVFTNQPGYVTGQFFDTNTWRFTTDCFQCYDVQLTNGLNTLTLHAADRAGNITVTNVTVTLDYAGDTNPPVLAVVWPAAGMAISGTNLTVQARVDEATARVVVTIVDAAGGTNTVPGLVERDGQVWAAGVPLAAGTNILTLTATDAAGNVSATNLALCRSPVLVTLAPLAGDQLNQPAVSLNGVVGDASYHLTVNGVPATVDETGHWTVDGVPVNATGTASVQVSVYDAGGQLVAMQSLALPQPSVAQATSYHENFTINDVNYTCFGGVGAYFKTRTRQWHKDSGGNSLQTFGCSSCSTEMDEVSWPAYWPGGAVVGDGTALVGGELYSYSESTPAAWQQASWHIVNGVVASSSLCGTGTRTIDREARTAVQLAVTPASQPPGHPRFLRLTVQAAAYADDGLGGAAGSYYPGFEAPGDVPLPVTAITLWGQPLTPTATNANVGELYVTLLPGTTRDALPVVRLGSQPGNYSFKVQAEDCNCTNHAKADWQQTVRNEIYADSASAADMDTYHAAEGFMANRANLQAVYAFYQKLFTANANLYWAGLGKLAGAPVYAGLSDAENSRGFISPTYVDAFQQTLINMNIAIYNDLAWQFEAYRQSGICALEEVHANDSIALDANAITAWRKIDQGVQQGDSGLIASGNKDLLQREQQQILANGYAQLSAMPLVAAGMSAFAKNPVPGGPDFATLEPSGDITYFPDRWDWITHSGNGMWTLWTETSVGTQLEWVEIPLKTRAADYATLTPIY